MLKAPNLFFALVLTALLSGCKPESKDQFDRSGMLTNLGNNVIVPAYAAFKPAAESLQAKAGAFTANPGTVQLDSLKAAFVAAYLAFQAVETYDFPASQDMRNGLNSFPAEEGQIENNVATGVYDLNTVNNLKAKGFPALDYLLYSSNVQQTIDLFTTATDAAKRKQYLTDIVAEIAAKAGAAQSEWAGTYVSTFIAASGTDIGSSTGMLVNDLSFETERSRRERVGNALGYVGLINGGVAYPKLVEAYHSALSKELLIENLRKSKVLFTGGAGQGFDDYLDYVGAEYNGEALARAISDQFDATILAAQNVPVAFSEAVNTHKPEMEALFLELKKLTVLIKVDMSSQLGVVINYSDNDGD